MSCKKKTLLGLDLTSIGALLSVIITCFAVFSILSLTVRTLDFQREISSSGSIIADEGFSLSRETIYWGVLNPDQTVSRNLTVTNLTKDFYVLRLGTANWNPANASDYIKLSWDYANQTITPYKVLDLQLFLHVDPNISGITTFTFDIIISSEAV